MKKSSWHFNILIFYSTLKVLPIFGQNLVFNGDVSIVDSCNLTISDNLINVAPNFFNPTQGTPDLFHTCSTNPGLSVPSNLGGFQNPFIGSGYLGVGLLPFFYEYISCKLLAPLKPGYVYCVSFYVARANNNIGCMDQIGISLTVNKYNQPNTDRIITSNFITTPKGKYYCEVGKWEKIELEYQAKGGEQYLTIGQFLPFEDVVFGGIVPPYYYVDAFSVIECASPPVPQISLPNVFSPNNDGVNDSYVVAISGAQSATTQIFNRWGSVVFESTDLNPVWDGTHNSNPVADGVYFVVVQASGLGDVHTTETQTVHLMR